MGFFSFHTNDTGISIPNAYSSQLPVTVYMKDDKGNVWKENNYEGYGVFGGKDFYALVAEMNGFEGHIKLLRTSGITICEQNDPKHFKYPNLVQDKDWEWRNECPKPCERQGFFYSL